MEGVLSKKCSNSTWVVATTTENTKFSITSFKILIAQLCREGSLHIACIDEKTKSSCELTVPASERQPQDNNGMDTS